MPVFEYRATNEDGKQVTGTVLSANLALAADDLAKRGLQVLQLQSAMAPGDPLAQESYTPPPVQPRFEQAASVESGTFQAPPTDPRSKVVTEVVGPLVNRVSLSHLMFFFRQLATMLNAGVGMVQALDTLSTQTVDPRLKAVIRELRDHVNAGRPISVVLQRYPEMFSPMILSLVRVGETGGMLERSCRHIAQYLEREIELRNLIRRVTFYPKLVIAASIIIVLATNAIIASLGKQGGLSSPLTSIGTWLWLGPLLVLIFLFVRVGLHNPRIQHTWQEIMLAIPGLGNTLRQLAMAKFGRAFGALYAGGVPPTEGVKLAADACGNEFMRSRIYPAAQEIQEGGGMADAFRRTGVFSPIVLDMVSTGERTGNVDDMLSKMAEFYEDEAHTRSYQFGMAFGVVCLLAVACYVGYMVVIFYMGRAAGFQELMD
jgi:type II secretory pathway component PulF